MLFIHRLLLSLFLVFTGSALTANSNATDTVATHDASVCSADGVALGGYDVVAYHTMNAAVLGDPEIVSDYADLNYRFSSEDHQQLFVTAPMKYLPHLQGWCAIALARNRLTCPDYENFIVEDGKLLLFETIAFVNGRKVWNNDPINNLISAEQNFKRFLNE